jgi:hypothetical protein
MAGRPALSSAAALILLLALPFCKRADAAAAAAAAASAAAVATSTAAVVAASAPRILVTAWSDRAAVHTAVFPALRAYCEQHGYAHRLLVGSAAAPGSFRRLGGPPRAPAWHKIELLVDAIDAAVASREFDLVVWWDDDILVADPSQSLATFADRFGLFPPLPHSPAPPLILCGSDSFRMLSRSTGASIGHPFNSGLILARASTKAAALLRLVWDTAPVLVPRALRFSVFEQEVFTLLWPALQKTVSVAAMRAIQSLSSNFLPGDFAFHAAGMATAERALLLAGVSSRCGAARRAAAGGPPLCDAPGYGGGARFATTPELLMAMVGAQLGRSVAAVGAPVASVHILAVVASNLRPACLYLVPRAGPAADDGDGDLALLPALAARLDGLAVNSSKRAAIDEGAAFFATGQPRMPDTMIFARVASAESLAAAAATAAGAEAGAAQAVAEALAHVALLDAQEASAVGVAAEADVAAASAESFLGHDVSGGRISGGSGGGGGGGGGGDGGGLAAVLVFAPRRANDELMAARLRESAGLVRRASGVVCVLGTRGVGAGGTSWGACSRPALSRAQMLAALRSGGGAAGFRVAGASLPWEGGGGAEDNDVARGEDASFFAASSEAGVSFVESWAANATARPGARLSWDCPAVCFSSG